MFCDKFVERQAGMTMFSYLRVFIRRRKRVMKISSSWIVKEAEFCASGVPNCRKTALVMVGKH